MDPTEMEQVFKMFNPRNYQEQLLDLCIKQNTILYLPTGSGKTYIAVMLMKQKMDECKNDKIKKMAVFIANTVALVNQQAEYISRHCDLKVQVFTGIMNIDYWDKLRWELEIANCEVMVMTSQVFLNAVQHGFIKCEILQVVIFDECHRAVNDQPMKKVMDLIQLNKAKPRILGLTGTLLNSDCKVNEIGEVLLKIETTFDSKIATILDSAEVARFSTNPTEMLLYYTRSNMENVLEECRNVLLKLEVYIMSIDLAAQMRLEVKGPENSSLMKDSRKINKKMRNMISDIKYHFEALGIYGGFLGTLHQKIDLHRMHRRAETSAIAMVLQLIMCKLDYVGKMLDKVMEKTPDKDRIFQFSSEKLLKLLNVLHKLCSQELSQNAQQTDQTQQQNRFTVLIFVDRRSSAKLLYQILKILSMNNPDFEAMAPDFVVGFSAGEMTRENEMEKKRNQAAIDRFKAGDTNVLVSSDVLEEGVDIPMCNTVIRFDQPKSYRSFVQSKGRARHKTSTFQILIEEGDHKFHEKLMTYRSIEQQLCKILAHGAIIINEPSDSESSPEKDDEVWFVPGSDAKLSASAAIPLLCQYCGKLPQDKFAELQPLWFGEAIGRGILCYVKLPMNSALKECVKGKIKSNKKLAKRFAALETIKELFYLGELTTNLSPIPYETRIEPDLRMFPLIEKEKVPQDAPQPGTRKRKQLYDRKIPDFLTGCLPQPGKVAYLHVLKVVPAYPQPPPDRPRKVAFYEIFKESRGYAILSAKKLPELCDFPIFTNEGQLDVKIVVNYKKCVLCENEINICLRFRRVIFGDVLDLLKSFMVYDNGNKAYSYLVVPTYWENGVCEIDWEAMKRHTSISKIVEKTPEEREEPVDDYDVYHHAVVAPWYRGLPPAQLYIVTQVCKNMSPRTPFPTTEFVSYEDYFERKYHLEIKHKDGPLFEVKSISKNINCLKPRSPPEPLQGMSKRKRLEQQKDFEEHLVPELCGSHDFPGVLWLKATCLPSILYRLSQMLLADELRRTIATELRLGMLDLPPGSKWKMLQDESYPEEVCEEDYGTPSTQLDNVKTVDDTPIDLDRTVVNDIAVIDILVYDKYCFEGIEVRDTAEDENLKTGTVDEFDELSVAVENGDDNLMADGIIEAPTIQILEASCSGKGPELGEVLKALTAASSHDVFNSERLETLGDSFLKFACSLFLFTNFGSYNEGVLSMFKNQIVGNSHFYNIAKNKGLANLLQVQDFSPRNGWMAPGIVVPDEVRKLMLDANAAPNHLYELILTEEEQDTGQLDSITLRGLREDIANSESGIGTHSSVDEYLGVQTISDKTMADSIEALVGVYLNAFGVEGALKFSSWLQIFPADKASPEVLLHRPAPSPAIGPNMEKDITFHLPGADSLEKKLGYKFKDRAFLLQALTHASYIQNRVTDCYQRLEFLGDAILDFLITSYLYENFTNLSPGDLTDLRSALVNNNTFASYAVKYGMHKFCRYASLDLFSKIDSFVRFQEAHNNEVTDEVLLLLEEDDTIAEAVDVPKVLGDLFESVAGAIFLDSGKCLKTVWDVYYRLMHNEISKFSENVPKSAVRILYEKCKLTPEFGKARIFPDQDTLAVQLDVTTQDEKKTYFGFGTTKKAAKLAAAKVALKDIATKNIKV